VVALGWWSLLSVVFAHPEAFSDWRNALNSNGLLPTRHLAEEFVQVYHTLADAGEVEDVPAEVYGDDVIEIGRVLS
jgi:hypothetical protein